MIIIDKKIIYFDNSATSFPKPESVYQAAERAMRIYGANPGRGGHRMAVEASKAVFDVREKAAALFNVSNPLQIGFTLNSTYALNFAVKGCLPSGGHIVTTALEHNSVLRPAFYHRDEEGTEVSIIYPEEDGNISADKVIEAVREDTKAVLVNHISNVTGAVTDIARIGQAAREKGVLMIVDASQSAGYLDIDVERDCIDILCFTGHKSLFGLQGTGGIYIREGIEFHPVIEGGTGSFSKMERQPLVMPEGAEAGTVNTVGIVTLGAGIDFINSVGRDRIKQHEDELTKRFVEGLKGIDEIKIYGPERRGPVVSLNVEGIDSGDLAAYLDEEYGIMVRAGIHCAPLAHKSMGTSDTGGVRFSFGYFNTAEEIDYAVRALKDIIINLKKF